jgi:hypothetical protein
MIDQPRVIDFDDGEISVRLGSREIRGWSYASDDERRQRMLQAREYVEGWCDGRSPDVAQSPLREALRRVLQDIDFMVERGIIPDVRNDIIYENARSAVSSTHQRCAKCGCETKGEAALVDGKIWCHPCADMVPSTSRATPTKPKCECGKPDLVSCYNPDCARPA